MTAGLNNSVGQKGIETYNSRIGRLGDIIPGGRVGEDLWFGHFKPFWFQMLRQDNTSGLNVSLFTAQT
jgi:hypothetical protein